MSDFPLRFVAPKPLSYPSSPEDGQLIKGPVSTMLEMYDAALGLWRFHYGVGIWKETAVAASTGNVNLAAVPTTLDGVTLVDGDRVLLKDQDASEDNGIYAFEETGAIPARVLNRATDADTGAEIANAIIPVDGGDTHAGTNWKQVTDAPITLGTTALGFAKVRDQHIAIEKSFPAPDGEGHLIWLNSPTLGKGLFGYDDDSDQWLHQGSGKAVEVFSAYRSADVSTPNGSVVVFDTKEFDPSQSYDASTGRFQPSRPGYYRLNVFIGLTGNATLVECRASLRKNGSHFKTLGQDTKPTSSGGLTRFGGSHVVYLNGDNDYVDIAVHYSDAATRTVQGHEAATYFGGHFVSNDYAGGIGTPRAHVARSSVQSIPNASWTDLIPNVESRDIGGLWDAGAPTRLTAPVAGDYIVTASALFDNVAGGVLRRGRLLRNNTDEFAVGGVGGVSIGSSGDVPVVVAGQIYLAAGDYVECSVYQDSGGALDIQSGLDFAMSMVPEPAGVIVPEDWHEIGAAGEPSFDNNWTNFGGEYATAAFRKDPFGTVHLKGVIKSGTQDVRAFLLPPSCRPAKREPFPALMATTQYGRVDVYPDGKVSPIDIGGGNTFVSLNGITFKAAP